MQSVSVFFCFCSFFLLLTELQRRQNKYSAGQRFNCRCQLWLGARSYHCSLMHQRIIHTLHALERMSHSQKTSEPGRNYPSICRARASSSQNVKQRLDRVRMMESSRRFPEVRTASLSRSSNAKCLGKRGQCCAWGSQVSRSLSKKRMRTSRSQHRHLYPPLCCYCGQVSQPEAT